MSFFFVDLWLGICVEVAVEGISRIRVLSIPPPPVLPPSLEGVFPSIPRTSCLTQVTVIWNQCAPQAGFGARREEAFTLRLAVYISFPSLHHVKLWDRTKLIRFAESVSSNIVLYSRFIWLNGSITLIRAETERYDLVRFSKVTTKSLASWTVKWIRREQNCRWTLTRAKTHFFSGVKSGSMLVCRPCDCTSGNLNKTSVREKSRGVYLPMDWVFPSYLMIFCLC